MDLILIQELLLWALGLISALLIFYLSRVYTRLDGITEEIKTLKKQLNLHEIDNIEKYPTRQECKEDLNTLKEHIQDVIAPIGQKMSSIEEYLRKKA